MVIPIRNGVLLLICLIWFLQPHLSALSWHVAYGGKVFLFFLRLSFGDWDGHSQTLCTVLSEPKRRRHYPRDKAPSVGRFLSGGQKSYENITFELLLSSSRNQERVYGLSSG